MVYRSALRNIINGRHTYRNQQADGYDDAVPQSSQSNTWSSTEYNSGNAWNVNFGSGNTNNNNKYNSNVVRPVVASMNFNSWSEYASFSNECKNSVPEYFLNSVIDAFEDCCRGKSTSTQCMEYIPKSDLDLPILAWQLWTDNYYPSTSTCFLVRYPKWREVFAANFRDRIVHHWLCIKVNPLFEQRFWNQGNVSFNCRQGFGTDEAVKHVADGIKEVTCNYQKKAWIFKGDLVGCFMSIDKDVMWQLSNKFVGRHYHGRDKDILMRVTKIIIYHHPEKDCILNSKPEWWHNLPSNKSLFRNLPNRGLPIGNLPTQIFTNFMLSYFDAYVQFIFRHHKFTYARFVDDFVICCDDMLFLKQCIPKIRRFLHDKLHFDLHIRKHYFQEASHGVLFVGSYIKPHRIYLSNRTIARMTERVHGFANQIATKPELSSADCARIIEVLNSYLGFTRHRRTYRIRSKLMKELMTTPNFSRYFYIEGHFEVIKVKPNYKPIQL